MSGSQFTTLDLSPLEVLIFGGTGGLGRAIGQTLAKQGAKVTVVGQTFRDEGVPNIKFIKADLSSIETSQNIAREIDVSNTDIVLFTTGILAAPQKEVTSEGLEKDMAVSFLNRLAIVNIIGPKLKRSTSLGLNGSRVFVMGFPGNGKLGSIDDLNQEKSYHYWTTHMNTVAGNEALVVSKARQYPNVNFYGLNPGLVNTNIRSNLLGSGYLSRLFEYILSWFTYSPAQYAANVAPILVSSALNSQNGQLFNNRGKELAISKGMTQSYADEFTNAALELLRKKDFNV